MDAGYKSHDEPCAPVVWCESLCQALAETVQKRHSSHPLEVFATTKESVISDDNIFIRIYLLSSYMSGSFLREFSIDVL